MVSTLYNVQYREASHSRLYIGCGATIGPKGPMRWMSAVPSLYMQSRWSQPTTWGCVPIQRLSLIILAPVHNCHVISHSYTVQSYVLRNVTAPQDFSNLVIFNPCLSSCYYGFISLFALLQIWRGRGGGGWIATYRLKVIVMFLKFYLSTHNERTFVYKSLVKNLEI
jgi:hypothetical protein